MVVTREKATKRICPMMLMASMLKQDTAALCCDPETCMAWRSVDDSEDALGFCGMAGIPPTVPTNHWIKESRRGE